MFSLFTKNEPKNDNEYYIAVLKSFANTIGLSKSKKGNIIVSPLYVIIIALASHNYLTFILVVAATFCFVKM